ncbi:MAG: potassium channel family protein [Planctomycetota bacterium]
MLRRRHTNTLLAAIVILFVVSPLMKAGSRLGAALLGILLDIVLISGVYALSGKRRTLVIALALALPAIALGWIGHGFGSSGIIIAGGVLYLVTIGYLVYVKVLHLFTARRVNFDLIAHALTGYLLLGIFWTMVYNLIWLADPAAFRGIEAEGRQIVALLYFSFTTLTTLGYGDIVPLSRFARSIATLEAIAGPIYLTIVIARLVGLQVSTASPPEEK